MLISKDGVDLTQADCCDCLTGFHEPVSSAYDSILLRKGSSTITD